MGLNIDFDHYIVKFGQSNATIFFFIIYYKGANTTQA